MAETKNDKFLRLMQKRLERTLEDFRMISQLASTNYRNTPAEAFEAIYHLDRGMKSVAVALQIPYKTWLGDPTFSHKQVGKQLGEINEIDAAKAIAHIEANEGHLAIQHLKAAVNKDPR